MKDIYSMSLPELQQEKEHINLQLREVNRLIARKNVKALMKWMNKKPTKRLNTDSKDAK